MIRKITILLILLICPFAMLSAESSRLAVSFNMSTVTAQGVISINFSNGQDNCVTATSMLADKCNYLDYDSIVESKSIDLDVVQKGNVFKAISPEYCFVNWKVYYKDPLDILLKVAGPLTAGAQDTINWQVSMHDPSLKDPSNVSGTLDDVPFEYSTSEMLVHTTSTPKFGRSGSRAFDIETQSLWGKELKAYTGNLMAIIRTVN